jgi:hypothetical protein
VSEFTQRVKGFPLFSVVQMESLFMRMKFIYSLRYFIIYFSLTNTHNATYFKFIQNLSVLIVRHRKPTWGVYM